MTQPKKPISIPKRFLGAFKAGHRPSARQFIEDDFAWVMLRRWVASGETDKEAEAHLEYMTTFNNEHHKNVVSKTNALHVCKCPNRKKGSSHLPNCLRNDLNERENAKNRDIMSKMVYGRTPLKEAHEEESNTYDYEDDMINALDHKEEWESFLEHLDKLDDAEIQKMIRNKKRANGKKKKDS